MLIFFKFININYYFFKLYFYRLFYSPKDMSGFVPASDTLKATEFTMYF